jgi:hypothetical protein
VVTARRPSTAKGQHFSSAGSFLLLFKEYALWTSFEIEVIMMAGEGTF